MLIFTQSINITHPQEKFSPFTKYLLCLFGICGAYPFKPPCNIQMGATV